MIPLLRNAPIDEVIVGCVLDRAVGPDAVEAGVYLAERGDLFVTHEIKDPVVSAGGDGNVMLAMPYPARTWLISADGVWLIQLQHDRFYTNWRRRPGVTYPGFTREDGVMQRALSEFARFREFCTRRTGETPNAAQVEMTKIDLLLQGKHWNTIDDACEMIPAIKSVPLLMKAPGPQLGLQVQEDVDGANLVISVVAARKKSEPTQVVFRVEFRATQAATGELGKQLTEMNTILYDAFQRLIPGAAKRFA